MGDVPQIPPGGPTEPVTPLEHPKRKGSVAPRSFRGRLVAGILIIIPLAVTAILIKYVYSAALTVGVWIVYYCTYALSLAFEGVAKPTKIVPEEAEWQEIGVAVFLTIAMLYLLGWLGTNVVGRRLLDVVEGLLERIPLVDTIYGSVKRMVHALSGIGKADDSPQRVVLVDFPHENMRAIAFLTNEIVDVNSGQRLATVYVPTTPNPTSGYMEIVPVERITDTDWTMEEALSMILSGGAMARTRARLYPFGTKPPYSTSEGEAEAAVDAGKGGGPEGHKS